MSTISLNKKIESYFNNANSNIFDGLSNSSDSLFISTINQGKNLIIVSSNNDGERLFRELKTLKKQIYDEELIFIPGTEEMPYDMVDSDKYLSSSKNLNIIKYINSKSQNITIITTAKNLQKKLLPQKILEESTIRLEKNKDININEIKDRLYKRYK